ncbi:MAG TPA: DUF1002 domain-containing protein [Pseudogracilibacillus sp.]|nr:DUF1002 domain-containing protein [Pseudogracilibacillus sp.]
MRKIMYVIVSIALLVSFIIQERPAAAADSYDELLGEPVVVYGEQLSDSQRDEVKRLLDVDTSEAEELTVNGEDIAHYIDGNPNSNMYSSVKITYEEEGKGIDVDIVSEDNITEVTTDMYENALLTAGVENATVEVASPVEVSGHSALTGIYKAYDEDGETLDQDRMETANEELDVTTELSKRDNVSKEEVTELMTEIKKEIAEQDPATKEEVEEIVKEQLDKQEIELSEEDRQMLTDLFDKIRDLDIDFGKLKGQLEDISKQIQDKMDDLDIDEGFWEKVKEFFNDMIDSLASLFK